MNQLCTIDDVRRRLTVLQSHADKVARELKSLVIELHLDSIFAEKKDELLGWASPEEQEDKKQEGKE